MGNSARRNFTSGLCRFRGVLTEIQESKRLVLQAFERGIVVSRRLVAIVLLALAGAACSGGEESAQVEPEATTTQATTPEERGATLFGGPRAPRACGEALNAP
jgi:hypothetical protein